MHEQELSMNKPDYEFLVSKPNSEILCCNLFVLTARFIQDGFCALAAKGSPSTLRVPPPPNQVL